MNSVENDFPQTSHLHICIRYLTEGLIIAVVPLKRRIYMSLKRYVTGIKRVINLRLNDYTLRGIGSADNTH